jgi:formate dehydrogenase subunit gamma
VDHLKDTYGLSMGDTRYDDSVTVEQVFCLGNCALGPAVQVDDRLLGRVDEDRLSAIVDEAIAR